MSLAQDVTGPDRQDDLLTPFPRCAAAGTVREACQGLVEDLAQEWELPSVYLLVDGRLRCMAAQGYFQVVDGFPTSNGVIGRVVTGAEVVVVQDAHLEPSFIAAVPGLRSEVCAPVMIDGVAQGAVSLESRDLLPPRAVTSAVAAAEALATTIARIGGLPPVPLAQRLARRSVAMSAETDVVRLREMTVEAALDVSGRSSAALSMMDADGRWQVCATAGPLGAALGAWTHDDLALVARWVAAGTSSHFPGGAPVPPEYEFLLASGVRSVGVQPLASGGVLIGVLTVADSEPVAHDPTVVAVIEILASLAATCLRTATMVGDLTDRATRDPLTGARNATEFDADLTSAAVDAVKTRVPRATCMLIDVDHFKRVNDHHGHVAGDALLKRISLALEHQMRESDALYRVGGDEFAAVVGTADPGRAASVAERLLEAVRQEGASISVGWAVVDRAPVAVRERADTALYAAKHAGRGVHRSASTSKA